MTREPAMTREEVEHAILIGIRLVQELAEKGYDIIATGRNGYREYDNEQRSGVCAART